MAPITRKPTPVASDGDLLKDSENENVVREDNIQHHDHGCRRGGSFRPRRPDGGGVGAPGEAPRAAATDTWVVMAGSSLKDTLEGWTRVSGWTLIWDSPVDYRMRASVTFHGGFEESASRLIDSIYNNNPELMATFHRGNRVLHIENQPLSSN